MTDSFDTRTLSRRTALVGIAAATLTPIAAAPVALAADHPDADLLAACERWQAGHKLLIEMIAETKRQQTAMVKPAIPNDLYETLELIPGHFWPEPDDQEAKYWSAKSLVRYSKPDSTSIETKTIQTGDGMEMIMRHMPVLPQARARAAELLPIAENYERQNRQWWAASEALDEPWHDQNSRLWDQMLEICAMPARTHAGLWAKVQILIELDVLPIWDSEEADSEQYALGSLTRDISGLAASA